MPVRKVPGGWQWGNQKIYKRKSQAIKQGEIIRRAQRAKLRSDLRTTIKQKKRK